MHLKLKSKPLYEYIINVTALLLLLILNSNAIIFNVDSNAQNFTFLYRDYLRNMIDIVDYEVQPCANFFQHACSGFKNFQTDEYTQIESEEKDRVTFSDSDRDVAPFLYNKQDHYVFFATHKQTFNTTPGMLLRNVYDLCKNSLRHTSGRRQIWRRIINDLPFLKHDNKLLRKWPFLEYQWEKYEPQLQLSWLALAAEFSAHGLNTFLNVFFAENTIYVAPNDGLQCPDRNEFGKSLLPLLGKRNPQIAEIVGGELWLLCHKLNGEEVFNSMETDKAEPPVNDIMGEFFQRLVSRLNFTDVEMENTHNIIFVNKLSETISLLHFTNPRIVYNFVVWQAYQHIANTDDCFQLTQEFDQLLQVEYWSWNAFDQHVNRDVAMALYLFHTTRFQKHYRRHITSTSWDRLFQNRSERKDLNIERSIKNYAKQYLDPKRYDIIFTSDSFSNERPNFYFYLLELRRLKIRYTFLNPYEETEDLEFFKEFLNFSILLLYRPRLHYFASYDREMWQNSKLLQSSDGLYAALDCLNRQTALNAEESDIYEEFNTELVNDIFSFYTAFIEVLSDYKFWLESENFAIAEDFILEYFRLNSTRVMFYAVAQQFCNRNDRVHRTLINRSYMNMPEFQEAFDCTPFDEMNPTTKCMVNQCLSN